MADEDGQVSQAYTDLYFRGSAHLGRLLKMLGLKRRAKDVSPGQHLIDLYKLEGKISDDESE
jgi:hypothetical protein